MSEQIQFEGESSTPRFQSRAIFGEPKTPKMVTFLINKGIVKNERAAGQLLLVLCIFFFFLTVYIYAVYVFRITQSEPAPLSEETLRAIGGER